MDRLFYQSILHNEISFAIKRMVHDLNNDLNSTSQLSNRGRPTILSVDEKPGKFIISTRSSFNKSLPIKTISPWQVALSTVVVDRVQGLVELDLVDRHLHPVAAVRLLLKLRTRSLSKIISTQLGLRNKQVITPQQRGSLSIISARHTPCIAMILLMCWIKCKTLISTATRTSQSFVCQQLKIKWSSSKKRLLT